jgi:hypothetical protein
MALMRRGPPAPPPLRLGALLVLCSLPGLAVPVDSGSTVGELSAVALLLPLRSWESLRGGPELGE